MQPGQTYLRDCARTPSDYHARVACKRHQKVAGITHPARDQDAARPILKIDVIGGHYAHDGPTRGKRSFSGNTSGRTSTPTHQSDSQLRDQFAGGPRQLIRA